MALRWERLLRPLNKNAYFEADRPKDGHALGLRIMDSMGSRDALGFVDTVVAFSCEHLPAPSEEECHQTSMFVGGARQAATRRFIQDPQAFSAHKIASLEEGRFLELVPEDFAPPSPLP